MMFVAQMSTFGGGGFEKDEHVAFEYVRRAAEKDCVQAVQQLGVRLLYGVGCERDLERAVKELEHAVDLGSTDSKEDLAKARKKLRQSRSCFRKLRKCCAKCCVVGESVPKNCRSRTRRYASRRCPPIL